MAHNVNVVVLKMVHVGVKDVLDSSGRAGAFQRGPTHGSALGVVGFKKMSDTVLQGWWSTEFQSQGSGREVVGVVGVPDIGDLFQKVVNGTFVGVCECDVEGNEFGSGAGGFLPGGGYGVGGVPEDVARQW